MADLELTGYECTLDIQGLFVRAQDDQDRAFDAMFEPHDDGYLVFGKRGGALFSAQERDVYVAAHRKVKPGWKTFPIVCVAILSVALIEFAALNALLALRPALRSSPDLIIGVLLAVSLTLPVVLMGVLAYPGLSLVLRIRREAGRRPPVAPPRAHLPLMRKLLNWVGFFGFIGLIGLVTAFVVGWIRPTQPWILVGCGLAGLFFYAASRSTKRE